MKTCSKCKTEKTLDNFAKKDNGKQSTCKSCHSLKMKEHYKNNKQYYKDKARNHENIIKDWYKEYKNNIQCAICGEKEPCCLDFHHIDTNNKIIEVSQAVIRSTSKQFILSEISKCCVLCANCHRKVHFNIIIAPLTGIEPACDPVTISTVS